MTQAAVKPNTYEADFQVARNERAVLGPGWLTDLCDEAWASFTQLGFPTARRGNEKWKYTNVAPIARTRFGPSQQLAPELDALLDFEVDGSWTRLVFVDGRYSRTLSAVNGADSGTLARNLGASAASGAPIVEQHLARQASYQDDGFTALNTAFLNDGAFVHVPEGSVSSSPVHLVFLTTGRDLPRVSYPRTLIVVEANAELSVVETYAGPPNAEYFTNAVTEISVGAGARVEHYRVSLEGAQAFHVGSSRVSQDRDSVFSSGSFTTGAALARNDFQVSLDGPGGSTVLNGLYLTADNQHVDNLIGIDHAQPNTSSQLNYKGILDGKSKAVFGGQVLVRKDAQKVNAQQSDKNLLLSDQAEVDSKPSLLIYADDVKCGHGATAGHIDQDSLFYLKSRGLAPDVAGRMLIHAFAREIIESVSLEPLRDYLDRLFMQTIPAKALRFGGKV